MGRQKPLRVWGPNGPVPRARNGLCRSEDEGNVYVGPLRSRGNCRLSRLLDRGQRIRLQGRNAVIYEDNGVTIRSFPAIHSLDGPVSFSLEWNDLKFVFGSDTYPNKWFVEYAKDADIAIHECFVAVPDLVKKMRFTPEQALLVGTQIHTAPEAFGKVMAESSRVWRSPITSSRILTPPQR